MSGKYRMNIYVGNLSPETTDNELRREFEEFGEVVSVKLMDHRDIGRGQPVGFAYVEMRYKSEGATAIAGLDGKFLREHTIVVVEARPLTR